MFEGLNATLRPIGTWPGEPTRRRRPAPFRASWSDTTSLLNRELRHLGASEIVLQLDYQERDLRVDGMPRANARMLSPGVIIAFQSKHGPLRYPCDTFPEWKDNVRAIALSLENLRAVDRYGVTRRAEQYAGWRALPSSVQPAMTAQQAAALLVTIAGGATLEILRRIEPAREAVRRAAAAAHPDRGGDHETFVRVQEAKRVLGAHFGVTF